MIASDGKPRLTHFAQAQRTAPPRGGRYEQARARGAAQGARRSLLRSVGVASSAVLVYRLLTF